MNDFRFVRKNWSEETARDYLCGAVYNAVLYAAGKESNGDYMVRFRVGGGGVYIAYWEDETEGMRAAHIQIGSPVLKGLSRKLDYTEADLDHNARLYWCPHEKGMPYSRNPGNAYTREWCLYEGVYTLARMRGWNDEGDDGKPKHKIFGEPRRDLVVDRMLEASKMGGAR